LSKIKTPPYASSSAAHNFFGHDSAEVIFSGSLSGYFLVILQLAAMLFVILYLGAMHQVFM